MSEHVHGESSDFARIDEVVRATPTIGTCAHPDCGAEMHEGEPRIELENGDIFHPAHYEIPAHELEAAPEKEDTE